MCEFCIKHGEGKKWYLNVKNYSDDLLSDTKRRKFNEDFFHWVERSYKKYFNIIKILPLNVPIIGTPLKGIIKRAIINKHWSQIIPFEDVEKVLSIVNSIVRIPCVCRKTTTGKEVRTCFLFTLNPEGIGMSKLVDQSFFGGPDVAKFEKINKTDALNFMKEQEKEGLFHTIWTHGTPFIGGICNCNDTGCIPFKMYKISTPLFFKAEYVVKIDKSSCVGCKACIELCPFNALTYDAVDKKSKINVRKCYGCGICQSVCKKNALSLKDRQSITEEANLW